jgi:hypothetical protein
MDGGEEDRPGFTHGADADAINGKLEIDPTIGEEIHKLVIEFLGMSPDLKKKVYTALKSGKSKLNYV